jgi:hypothetical protein
MRSNRQLAASLSLAAILAATGARAADGGRDFCADRPGKDTPACILDVGRIQFETSLVDYTHDRQAGVSTDTTDYGDLELRFGLTPTLEAEIAWSPYVTIRTHGGGVHDRVSGSGDLTFGVRQSLRNPDGSGFSAAIQPFVTAPTGRSGIGAGAWQGGVIVPLTWQVSDAVGVGLTPELDVVPDQDGHGAHLAWTGVAAASRQVGSVTLAADLWVSRDEDPAGATTQASLDVDAAWQPASLKDLQFDVGVNAGLNHDTPDVEAYFGLARRF